MFVFDAYRKIPVVKLLHSMKYKTRYEVAKIMQD